MSSTLSEKEIRQRTPWLLLALLVLNFVLMAADAAFNPETKDRALRTWASTIAAFVQGTATGVGNTGTDAYGTFASWSTAIGENESLKQRVNQLEVELEQQRGLVAENERLQSLLSLRETIGYQQVPAQVIARDPSVWFDLITINRGRNAGVALNMPVVTGNGVVGRVVATSPLTAQVQLVTDDKSGIGTIIGEIGVSNAIGTVRGAGGRDLLEMNYVSGQETVNPGDVVLTTGQDQLYPSGLKIGTVVEVEQGSATTPHRIFVKPSVRIGSLREVTVLLYQPPTPQTPDQTLPNFKPQGERQRRR